MILPKFIIVGDSRLERYAGSALNCSYWDCMDDSAGAIRCLRRASLWDKKRTNERWLFAACETLQLSLEAV